MWEENRVWFFVLLIDWLMTLMIIKDEVFFVCRCVYICIKCIHMCVELGEYVVWNDDLTNFFLVCYGIGVFLSFLSDFIFFFLVQKSLWGKTRDSETLCSKYSFGSVRPSVGRSGGQREKGQRWMLFFFFLPVLFVEETFLQRVTRLTYSLQHIHFSHTVGPHLCKISNFFSGEVFIFLSFFIFFQAWPRKWGKTAGVGRAGTEFVYVFSGDELVFTRFSRQAWLLGESWRKLFLRSHRIGL